MAANAGTAYIDIEARLDKLQHELDSKISSAAKNASGEASKSFKHTGTAIVGAIAGGFLASKGLSFIEESLKAASEESTGIAALNKVLANTGVPKKAVDSTQEWLTKIQDSTGVLKDQLEPAFTRLVSAHIPLQRAQTLFNQALDISKARSVPLATVTAALGKAYNGQLGGLTRLGIQVPKNITTMKDFQKAQTESAKAFQKMHDAQQALSDLEARDHAKKHLSIGDLQHLRDAQQKVQTSTIAYEAAQARVNGMNRKGVSDQAAFNGAMKNAAKTMGGTAAAAANTAAGKLAIFHARVHEVQVKIGEALIPILTKLGGFVSDHLIPAFEGITTWMSKNKDIVIPLAAVIGTLAVGLGILAAVEKTVELATAALNLVMDANPMVLVALAVAALVAGLIIAYQRVKWFRDFVNAAWGAIKTAALDLWHGLQKAWDTVGKPVFQFIKDHIGTVIDGVKLYLAGLKLEFEALWRGAKWAWDNIGKPIFNYIKLIGGQAIQGLINAYGGARDAFQWLWAAAKYAWEHIGKPVFHTLRTIALPIISAIKLAINEAKAGWGLFATAVQRMWSLVSGPLGHLWDILSRIFGIIGSVVSGVGSFINSSSGGAGAPHGLDPGGAAAAARAGLTPTTRGGGQKRGQRAKGGPVVPFGVYDIGENGPEKLVMGARGGYVIPNQGGGRGITVVQNFHGQGWTADQAAAAQRRAEKLAAVV